MAQENLPVPVADATNTPLTIWQLPELAPRGPGIGRRNSKWFIIVLLLVYAPVALSLFFNNLGATILCWALVFVFALIDLRVLLHIKNLGWTAAGGFIRRQPGGNQGPSWKDGFDGAEAWLKTYFNVGADTIIASRFALVWLAIIPVDGFGWVACAVLSLTPLLTIWALRYKKEDSKVVFWMGLTYCAIVVGLMVYWVAVWQFPELRQSAAKKEVSELETVVANQNDSALQERVRIIKDKLAKLDAHLTMAEREARLTQKERDDLELARNGTFVEKAYDKAAPVVVDRASKGTEWFLGLYQQAHDAFFYEQQISMLIDSLQPKQYCDPRLPENGRVIFTLLTKADLIVAGGESRVSSYFRLNGAKSGGSIKVKNHCVERSFVHPTASYLNNPVEPQIFEVLYEGDFWYWLFWVAGLAVIVVFVLPWVGRRTPVIRRFFGSPAPSGVH